MQYTLYSGHAVLFNACYLFPDVVEGKMGEVLGEFRCELDGRFSSVRTAETNLGRERIERKSRLMVPLSDLLRPLPPPSATIGQRLPATQ
jgi:hypothetical protein